MAKRRYDFLCFLASQAKQDIKAKVEETAFKILYPMERKTLDMKQHLEERAFQLLYPVECGYHKGCEQVAKTAFQVIYPVELKSKAWKQNLEEQAFHVLYPIEQKWQQYLANEAARKKTKETSTNSIDPLVERYKNITLDLAKHQEEQRLALLTCKEQWVQKGKEQLEKFAQKKVAYSTWIANQASKIKQYFILRTQKRRFSFIIKNHTIAKYHQLQTHQLSYVRHTTFKLMHRKLERLYEHQCSVFHRYYSLVCNRIARYFAMLFGISNYWARASSVTISIASEHAFNIDIRERGTRMKKRKRRNWQQGCYRTIISTICAMMIITLIPMNLVEVKAAPTGIHTITIEGATFTTDEHELMAYRKMPNTAATYDIYGKYNGKWIQTTYQYSNPEERGYVPATTGSNVKVEATPVFINEGRYIQMNYKLTSTTPQTISFSIAADIMIGSDDYAPITSFSDKSGFKMVNNKGTEKGAQFNFYGKNVYGASPGVSTYWFGYYGSRNSYRYTQVSENALSGKDSAMSCSWKNLAVNSTGVNVSMIIGTGEANVAPEIGQITIPDSSTTASPGSNMEVTVPVSNASGDNSASKIKLYYSLVKLDGTIIDGPNQITDVTTDVQGSITKFIARFKIPNNMPSGPFILKVFAMNDKGGISAEVQKQLQATAKPITITSTSENQDTTYGTAVPINVTVSSSATSDNPLLYQWQALNSSNVYQDIAGATSATYRAPASSVGTTSYRCKVRYQNDSASSVFSTAIQVVVNKLASKTVLTNSFNSTSDTLTLKATVSAGGSAENGTVLFYNGNTQIGTATTSNGVASLSLVSSKLESGTQNIYATFTGSAKAYASTSDTQKVTINLKMKILYDQFISSQDGGVVRSYREGMETILKDPLILRDGYNFAGWMNSAGAILDRITATMRGDVTLTSQWTPNTYRVTIDDNIGSDSTSQTQKVGSTVTINAPSKTNYVFSKWSSSDANLIKDKETNANLSFVMPAREVSLVAQYTEKSFKITYQDSTPLASWPTTYTYGSTQNLPEPSKAGYIFMGWHKGSAQGEVVNQITSDTSGDITLYPAWSKLYKVKIQTSLGSQVQTSLEAEYASGDDIIIPSSSYEGYSFKNWEVKSGNLTLSQPTSSTLTFQMPTSDVTIQANYAPLQYALTYETNGGINDENNLSTYSYGSSMSFAPATKEGYRFDGWYTDAAFQNRKTSLVGNETGALKLYAKFSVDSYLLTLNDAVMKNESASSLKVNFGTKVTITPTQKNGYSFTKWTTQPSDLNIQQDIDGTYFFTMPAGEVKIKAEYEKTSYTINYHVDEAVDITNKTLYPDKYVLGYSKTLANPSKTGFTFDGWYKDSEFKQSITKIEATDTGNLNLYPKWTTNTYQISVNGGAFEDQSTSKDAVAYQSEVKASPKVPTGMQLKEWMANNQVIIGGIQQGNLTYKMPAENTVLQANYEPSAYTITYDLNASEALTGAILQNPNASKTTYTFGDSYTLAYPTATNASGEEVNTFDGWMIKGTTTKIASITPTTAQNLELVAKWTTKSYKISYEGIDGAINENELNGAKYDATDRAQDIPLNEPKKIGYTFKGWELKNSGASASIVNATTLHLDQSHTGDITLHATWQKADIAFLQDNVTKTGQIDQQVSIQAPAKEGYVFDHWNVEGNAILQDASNESTSFVMSAALIESIHSEDDLKITSVYRLATYQLTYRNLEDAVNNNPTEYTYGTEVKLSDPVRSGYEFNGWNGLDQGIISATDTGNKTLEATWTAIDYDVVVNEGTSKTNPAHVKDSVQIQANQKSGYSFEGWSVVKGDVSVTNDEDTTFTMPAGDVEVSAQYALVTYHIDYFDGANKISNDNPSTYTIEEADIVLKPAIKDGYDFNGWYDNKDEFGNGTGNKVETIAHDGAKDLTLYANFTKKKHTIKVTTSGLGSYEFRVDGQVHDLTNNEYVTDETGQDVRILFYPENGYSISSILINGVPYQAGDTIRFENFTGVYDIKVQFKGSPVITPPSGSDITWVDGNEIENTIGTNTKKDVSITLTPITGTTTSYQIVKAGDPVQENGWLAYENTIELTQEGRFVVYVKVDDGAGNVTIIHSKVIVIDKTAPVLKDKKGQVVGENQVIYTDQSFQVTEDNLASIQVNGTIVNQVTLSGNKEATYRIVISDKAGNKREYIIFAKTILNHEDVSSIKNYSMDQVKVDHKQAFNKAIATLTSLKSDAPTEQASYIQSLIQDYQGKLAHIDAIQTSYNKYIESAGQLKEDVANEQALKTLYDNITAMLGKDNLTAQQRTTLTASQKNVSEKMELVAIQKDLKAIQNIKQDNVTTDSETKLREVDAKIEAAMEDNAVLNQNPPLKETLVNEKERVTALLVKIDDIKKALSKADELLQNENIGKPIQKPIKDEIRDILEEYAPGGNLTTAQKKHLKDIEEILDVNDILDELYQFDEKVINSESKDRVKELQDIIVNAKKDNEILKGEKEKEMQQVVDVVDNLVDILDKVENNLNKIEDALQQDFSKPMNQGKIDDAKTALSELKDSTNTTSKEKEFVKNSDVIIQVIDQINQWKDVTKDTISIEKKKELEALIEQIERAKENALLTDEKRKELLENVERVEGMIQQINKTNNAWNSLAPSLNQPLGNDRDALGEYIKRLEDFLSMYGKNLDSVKLAQLKQALENAKKQLQIVEEADKAYQAILPDIDQQFSNDWDTLTNLIKRIEAFLSAYGSIVDSEHRIQFEQALGVAKIRIESMKNPNLSWSLGNDEVSLTPINGLKLPYDVKMLAEKITDKLPIDFFALVQRNLAQSKPDYVLGDIFDIKLMLDQATYRFDGLVEVKIKLNETQQHATALGIIYIDDDGNIQEVESRVDGEYIVFAVAHFSKYAIIYKDGPMDDSILKDTAAQQAPQDGSMLLLLFAATLFLTRKKRNSI